MSIAKFHRIAVLSLTLAVVAASANATEIALVDVARVFKEYDRFTLEMADLKARTTDVAAAFQQKSRELQLLKEEYQTKEEGSEEQLQLKAQMERLAANLKASMDDQKRRLQREEAELYADAYEEVLEAIRRIAREENYSLVLRYKQAQEIDRTSSKTILSDLNRSVLYHSDLDVTDAVIALLTKDSSPDAGQADEE